MKQVFIDGLQFTIRCGARMFWGCELEAHLMKFAYYVETLLKQQHGQVEELKVAPKEVCTKEKLLREAVVAAVEETDNWSIGNQIRSTGRRNWLRTMDIGPPAADSSRFADYAWRKTIAGMRASLHSKCSVSYAEHTSTADVRAALGAQEKNTDATLGTVAFFNYPNCNKRPRNPRARGGTQAAPQQQQKERPTHLRLALLGGSNPKF